MQALSLEQLQGTSTDGTDGLRGVLAGLMGIPCDFRKQSGANQMRLGPTDNLGARAWVDLLGSSTVVDEVLVEGVDADDEFPEGAVVETAYGIRERVIQVTALSQNQQLHKSARAYLELLEDKLPLTSTGQLFRALGLASLGAEPIQVLDPEAFGRCSSVAAIDLRFRYGTRREDERAPVIANTHVSGAIDGRAGALDIPLPEPEP